MSYTVGSTRVINTTSASGTTDFTFTFPYIKEAHIEVYKDYTKLNQGTGATEYQVITNVSPKLVRLGTATASANVRLEIRRNSSLDTPLVDYADGSTLTANDLDTSALQSLYIDQELKDSQFQTVSISATTGHPTLNNNPLTEVADPTNAQDAATKNYVDTNDALKLAKAGDSMTGALAMGTNKVTGVGDPTAAQDAATKSYVDALSTGGLDSRYYTETELDAGQLDNRYYTETESDARYFNVSTGDTIKDGDAFPDNDTTIATTAAINDRIVDLVDDVGGFVPIANETSFPTANPDVNNGTGTLVSIKAFAASHTPSGGTVTIANGAGSGNTVTITGCGTTVLAADYGGIVETTATLHTYSFHRLVPKATEVTSVATNVSPNITNINTVANNISDVNNFADLYQIASSAPSTDGGGNALADGDLYFNTTNNELQVYNGSAWQGGVTAAGSFALLGANTFTGDQSHGEDIKTQWGADNDLQIYHQTGVPGITHIKSNTTADFEIGKAGTNSGNVFVKFGSDDSAIFKKDGAVELYYDDVKSFETNDNGATVYGGEGQHASLYIYADEGDDDADKARIQQSSTGDFWIENYASGSWEAYLKATGNAGVELYYDNVKKFETQSGGVKWTGNATSDGHVWWTDDKKAQFGASNDLEIYHDGTVNKIVGKNAHDIEVYTNNTKRFTIGSNGNTTFEDDVKSIYGTGSDLRIYHDGSHSYLNHTGTGHLYMYGNGVNDIYIRAKSDENSIIAKTNGAVELYYDNSKKFETVTGGVTVTGTISDSTGELRTIVQNTQAGAYTLVAADAGKHILASGNITVPDSVFSAGQAITIVNNTAGDLTITKGTNMYNTADGTNANRTLATRGMATLLFTAADTAYISGAGLS